MQYGMFYIHPLHQTDYTDAYKIYHAVYTALSLRMNPRGSKILGDNKLNNLENCAFR